MTSCSSSLRKGFVKEGGLGFCIVAGLACDGATDVMQGREIRSVLRPPAAVRRNEGEAMALGIHVDIEAFRHHVLGSLLQRFRFAMLRTGTIAPLAVTLNQQGGVVWVGL